MINRIIYNGKVYYKVADLADLFEVSKYKMRNIIKTQDIGTNLNGFGRALFVLEENVAKIEVRNEIKVLETKFTADPVKKIKTVNAPVIPAEKPKKRTKKVKQEKSISNVVELAVKQADEKIQNEFEKLMGEAKKLGKTLYLANEMAIANEISDEYFGTERDFLKATIDDIDKLRLLVPKLMNAVADLNKISDEIAATSDDSPDDETELSF
jgi:hypothetical protein